MKQPHSMVFQVAVPIATPQPLDGACAVGLLVAAIAIVFVTVRRPAFGLALLIVCEPFDFSRSLGPTTATLPKALVIGFIVGLACKGVSLSPLREIAIRNVFFGTIAVAIVTALTIVPATYFDPVVRETFKAAEYAVLFASAVVAYRADPDEDVVWGALGIAALLVCSLAFVQLFTVAPSGFALGAGVVPRIAGPLEGPNQLAGWLAFVAPVLAARALRAKSRGYVAIVLFALVVDALTYSRAGVLGTFVGVACVALAGFRRRVPGVVLVASIGIVVPSLVAFVPLAAVSQQNSPHAAVADIGIVSMRLSGKDEQRGDTGLSSRDVLWRAALTMFARSPALGVGAGNFELLTPTVGLIGVRTHANSLYFQSLAEGGIALLGALAFAYAALLRLLARDLRASLVLGVGAGVIALAMQQIFDTIVFYPKVGDVLWLLAGVAAAHVARTTTHDLDARA